MKISQAFRQAFRTVAGQKAEALKLLAAEFAVTGICIAPLLILTETGPLQYLAALSAVLWLLVKVPARLNAAAAMQDGLGEGKIFSLRLADPGNYGKKLGYAFARLGLLTLWALPATAAVLYGLEMYSGQSANGLTVTGMIYDLGGQDMKTGIFYLLLILAGLILIAVLGIGFHSGDRHAFALGEKKLLKGQRPKVLLCWICSLVFVLPMILAAGIVSVRYLPKILFDVLMDEEVPADYMTSTLIILGIGAVLSLPMLPLRSMVTAAYVNGLKKS